MKKLFLYLGVMALLIAGAGDLLAGSIDYLSNQSAPFVRNLSRNAITDSADAVNYNPAGTAVMKDGLYLQVNNQTILKTYTQTPEGGDDLESTEPTLILPSAYVVYKMPQQMPQLSIFGAFTVPAGGGKVNYEDGNAEQASYRQLAAALGQTTESSAEGSSMYLAGTLGVGYAINEMIAVSLGGRYINAKKTGYAKTEIQPLNTAIIVDYEDTASGFGGIAGINVKATPELNIGIRYEMQTNLKFDRKVTNDGSNATLSALSGGRVGSPKVSEGKYKRNLPAVGALGADYMISPEMKAGLSFTYFFIENADAGKKDLYNDKYKDGWEAAAGFEYKIMPELVASLSYMYSKMGSNKDTISDTEIVLDANTIGLGAKYTITEGLDITLGLAWAMYTSMENADKTVEYSKDNKMIALGIDYKAL